MICNIWRGPINDGYSCFGVMLVFVMWRRPPWSSMMFLETWHHAILVLVLSWCGLHHVALVAPAGLYEKCHLRCEIYVGLHCGFLNLFVEFMHNKNDWLFQKIMQHIIYGMLWRGPFTRIVLPYASVFTIPSSLLKNSKGLFLVFCLGLGFLFHSQVFSFFFTFPAAPSAIFVLFGVNWLKIVTIRVVGSKQDDLAQDSSSGLLISCEIKTVSSYWTLPGCKRSCKVVRVIPMTYGTSRYFLAMISCVILSQYRSGYYCLLKSVLLGRLHSVLSLFTRFPLYVSMCRA